MQKSPMMVSNLRTFIHFLSLCTEQAFNPCNSRPDVCQCLIVQTSMDGKSKNRPSIAMIHEVCKSKVRSILRSSMHTCPGNLVAIRRAVAYYAWAAHTFSAGIKCRHCRWVGLEQFLNLIAYGTYTVCGLAHIEISFEYSKYL